MSKKVLVIEDDEQISRVYLIKLKQEGIEAITSADGEDGLKKMASEKPDLVLLDLMLPGKDGFWVMEERNKIAGIKNVPVLVLSNLGQEQDRKRALGLGAIDYLVKADLSIKEVMDEVKKNLA